MPHTEMQARLEPHTQRIKRNLLASCAFIVGIVWFAIDPSELDFYNIKPKGFNTSALLTITATVTAYHTVLYVYGVLDDIAKINYSERGQAFELRHALNNVISSSFHVVNKKNAFRPTNRRFLFLDVGVPVIALGAAAVCMAIHFTCGN